MFFLLTVGGTDLHSRDGAFLLPSPILLIEENLGHKKIHIWNLTSVKGNGGDTHLALEIATPHITLTEK